MEYTPFHNGVHPLFTMEYPPVHVDHPLLTMEYPSGRLVEGRGRTEWFPCASSPAPARLLAEGGLQGVLAVPLCTPSRSSGLAGGVGESSEYGSVLLVKMFR